MPEAMMGSLLYQSEARCLVNTAGRDQHALCPQGDFLVSRLLREANTFIHQGMADAETSRFRLDQQQP